MVTLFFPVVCISLFSAVYGDPSSSTPNAAANVANILDTIGMISRAGGALQHLNNVRGSLDPERFEPTHPDDASRNAGTLKNTLEKIGNCDPKINGLCCLMPNYCAPNAICKSTKPTTNLFSWVEAVPICECPKGFRGDGLAQGTGCMNVDECLTGEAKCEQLCFDTSPGYTCGCHPGYTLAADNVSCVEIDECAEGTANCSQICINTAGSYRCACKTGYELAEDGRTCVDIDECSVMGELAAYNRSRNTPGTPHPLSKTALAIKGTLRVCDYVDLCINFDGGYTCGCPLGYQVNASNAAACDNVNECTSGVVDQLNFTGLVSKPQLSTGTPVVVNPPICVSAIDRVADSAIASQTCTNKIGSFACACAPGFEPTDATIAQRNTELSERSLKKRSAAITNEEYIEQLETSLRFDCRDIDECDAAVDPCTGEQRYTTTTTTTTTPRTTTTTTTATTVTTTTTTTSASTSTSEASTTNRDTENDGGERRDVEEDDFNLPEPPKSNAATSMANLAEAVTLHAQRGKRRLETATSPKALCVNKIGSYTCQCPKGFEYRDVRNGCVELDQCSSSELNLCVEEAGEACIKTPGSYVCGCAEGFRPILPSQETYDPFALARNISLLNKTFCEDIDECAEGIDGCDYQCHNTYGSYTCSCPVGYMTSPDDKRRCVPIPLCDFGLCPPNVPCIDLPGTYICGCPRGKFPDPSSSSTRTQNQGGGDAFIRSLSKETQRLIKVLQAQAGGNHDDQSFNASLCDWDSPPWDEQKKKLQEDIFQRTSCIAGNVCRLVTTLLPGLCPAGSTCTETGNGAFRCDCPQGYKFGLVTSTSPPPPKDRMGGLDRSNSLASMAPARLGGDLFSGLLNPLGIGQRRLEDIKTEESLAELRHEKRVGRPKAETDVPLEEVIPPQLYALGQALGLVTNGKSQVPLWVLAHLDWRPYAASGAMLDGATCIDINECTEGIEGSGDLRHVCPNPGADCCENLPGTFRCIAKRFFGLHKMCPAGTVDMSVYGSS